MDLASLKMGERAIVVSITGDTSVDTIARRLLELGFIPGTPVDAMHKAPVWGDPISFLVRGTHVALRREEAKKVIVKSALEPSQGETL